MNLKLFQKLVFKKIKFIQRSEGLGMEFSDTVLLCHVQGPGFNLWQHKHTHRHWGQNAMAVTGQF